MSSRRKVAVPGTSQLVDVPTPSRIKCGNQYELQDERIEIVAIDGLQAVARLLGAGLQKTYELDFLEENASSNEGEVDLKKVAAADWERAKQIKAIVVRVIHENITSRTDLTNLGRPLKLECRQLQRYVARYRARPYVSSCLKKRTGREKGNSLYPKDIDSIVVAVINEHMVDRAVETSLHTIEQDVRDRCARLMLKPPHATYIWRRLRSLGHSLSKRRNKGPAKYRESISIVEGSHDVPSSGYEFQIDHTLADIMITDESRHLILGRPWLTLVLDTFSSCVCGFYLSFRPPSMQSVARALTVAVSNKREFLDRIGLKDLHWPMEGIPLKLFTDRAREFQSKAFERGCEENHIDARLRPRQGKHWGGRVERVIGTYMGRLHLLPGTTFSNIPRRIRYDPAKDATYTGFEIMQRLVAMVCEHHDTPRRNGLTPNQLWELGRSKIPAGSGCLRYPNMTKFYRDFLPEVTSKRQRDGIHWGDYRYTLGTLRSVPVGQPVTYIPDPLDSSTVSLILPSGGTIAIPREDEVTYDNHELESQLRAVLRYANKHGAAALRREEANAAGRRIDDQAKAAKAAARRRAFEGAMPPVANPCLPSDEATEPAHLHVGEYVAPSKLLVPRRMR